MPYFREEEGNSAYFCRKRKKKGNKDKHTPLIWLPREDE